MCTTFRLLVLFAIVVQRTRSTNDGETVVRALTNFFIRRHVQTVTANTCCQPCDINGELFKSLSSNDISVSFGPFARQSAAAANDQTWYRHGFVVDLSCRRSTEIFRRVSDDRLFNTQNDWVLLCGKRPAANETTSSLARKLFETYLGNAYVLPDSGVFLFAQDASGNDVWEIWNGFRAGTSDTIRAFRIGWASQHRCHVNDDWNGERRRFRGITLRANTVIVDREHFFGFNTRISSDLDIFSHMHYAMTDILSYQLDFKMTLGVNAEYGWSFGNGTFGGLMGALQNNEIDLSAAGVLIRTDRMAVVDYTISTMPIRTTVLFRQPQLSSVYNILLLPFTFELWLMILVTLIVFVIVLVLLTRANHRLIAKRKCSLNLQDALILVHGAICQQSTGYKMQYESIRVVVFVLFLTSVFVYTSYSASIASLIQSNSNSIKSIRDIVESPMTFSAQTSPYGKYYFEETEDPLIKQLYETKLLPSGNKGFSKAPDGMERTRTEFHGFMSEVISAYKIIGREWREEEKCGLAEIQLFRLPPLSIPLVKKSGHRDLFKQKLIQQMEIGLIKRVVHQWIASKPSCGGDGRAKVYVSVSMTEIHLTLKIFGCGVFISLAVLAIEVAYHYWTESK